MFRHGWLSLAMLVACSDDGTSVPPVFPATFAATYQEVRSCRYSIDHDIRRVRTLASPEAAAPYSTRTAPFPTGAIVLKVEYEDDDTSCAGPIINYTVMKKVDIGSATALLDWEWQEVDAKMNVVDSAPMGCASCHKNCGKPPDGYDGTCTPP